MTFLVATKAILVFLPLGGAVEQLEFSFMHFIQIFTSPELTGFGEIQRIFRGSK